MADPNELTQAEKYLLEEAIGAGAVELGYIPDGLEIACRKLGLNPLDWHGNRMLVTPTPSTAN